MKRVIFLAVILVLAGCTEMPDGGKEFVGSPHGYVGSIDTPRGTHFNGAPAILQQGESALQAEVAPDGSQKDMVSTYSVMPDGSVRVTGPAVKWMALARFCAVAPAAKACGDP